MLYIVFDGILSLIAAVLYASWAEWKLHKDFMHQLMWWLAFARHGHSKHHTIFRYNFTYLLQKEEDKDDIRFAWWHGITLVAVGGLPFWCVAAALGYWWRMDVGVTCGATSFTVFFLDYLAFESLHWCMHNPTGRFFEKWRLFRWMYGRHILHHLYQQKNLNVVLPLADWWFGTYLARSPQRFEQPAHSSVPDLQPLSR